MIELIKLHYTSLIKAFWETNFMLVGSAILCFIFSIPFGILLFAFSRGFLLKNNLAYQILSIFLNTLRSIPFLIFIFILIPINRFIFGTAFGNIATILPLTLVSVSIYTRFVEQALINVPERIIHRAISMGATKFQMVRYFLLPSIKTDLILSFTSVCITILSCSTVMGVIGAGGLGQFAYRYGYQEYDYPLMYLVVVIFIIYVFVIQAIGYTLVNKSLKLKKEK